MSAYSMYVLRCSDGSLYTGYTTDVEARVAKHNAGIGAKYTAARRPVVLKASAGFDTKHAAMSAEFHFKQLSREEKLTLISQASDSDAFARILIQRFGF